tara:strand:+ start:1539 stop:3509 length:1971 start_codon:yes stop_codon:yes gene_type:complete
MLEIELVMGVLAIIVSIVLAFYVIRKPSGNEKMKEISELIHKGALTFLRKEYEVLIIFVVIVAAILFVLGLTGKMPNGQSMAITFIIGSICSALAGNIGMRIATKANSRTAEASKSGLASGFQVAFFSGVVMSMGIVGVGLLGVIILYLIYKDPAIIFGFGFGASSIALFARVGGGIYTKAADVGADLVGKVEAGIPEDDPRNPAVIADNVGDNVGDVAGMGADLFESYVNSMISAMILGLIVLKMDGLLLPISIAGIGILSSIIGVFFVRVGKSGNVSRAMNMGVLVSTVLMIGLTFILIKYKDFDLTLFYSIVVGLISGVLIGLSTEYFTSSDKKPAQSIANASETGAATNLIQGLAVGMMSTFLPVIIISLTVLFAFKFAGLYGIALAAVGMLSTLGITLAIDTYGPVADNAAGIAEMAGMGPEIRKRTEALDAVGNTTAAIGKGFAIGSAALTALALFASYTKITNISVMNIGDPKVVVGLFIGGMLPFLFSSFALLAVGKAAGGIVKEVRRQFKEIKGIMSGKGKPDYNRCIEISTKSSLRQMIVPSLLAILSPIIVGLIFGPEALGGLLIGSIATGFSMAVFQANAGGAWDNAKKYVEAGNLGGKGSDVHKATVVGDTVGDPFKDTSGPAINILLKLMSIVAVVFVPLFL